MTDEAKTPAGAVALIDPDPFVIAQVWLAAAAVILQIAQFARDTPANSIPTGLPEGHPLGDMVVNNLQIEVERLRNALNKAKRAIERGARDADREFYDVKFRLGMGPLKLEMHQHQEFSQNLALALAALSNMSLWINNLLAHHPHHALKVGERMVACLEEATTRLNDLMAKGAPNRDVIFEAGKIIELAAKILDDLDGGN